MPVPHLFLISCERMMQVSWGPECERSLWDLILLLRMAWVHLVELHCCRLEALMSLVLQVLAVDMFISSQQSSRGGGGINSQAIKAAVTVYFWPKPYLCLPVRTFSGWNLCLLCNQVGIAPTYWDPNVRILIKKYKSTWMLQKVVNNLGWTMDLSLLTKLSLKWMVLKMFSFYSTHRVTPITANYLLKYSLLQSHMKKRKQSTFHVFIIILIN